MIECYSITLSLVLQVEFCIIIQKFFRKTRLIARYYEYLFIINRINEYTFIFLCMVFRELFARFSCLTPCLSGAHGEIAQRKTVFFWKFPLLQAKVVKPSLKNLSYFGKCKKSGRRMGTASGFLL